MPLRAASKGKPEPSREGSFPDLGLINDLEAEPGVDLVSAHRVHAIYVERHVARAGIPQAAHLLGHQPSCKTAPPVLRHRADRADETDWLRARITRELLGLSERYRRRHLSRRRHGHDAELRRFAADYLDLGARCEPPMVGEGAIEHLGPQAGSSAGGVDQLVARNCLHLGKGVAKASVHAPPRAHALQAQLLQAIAVAR